MPLLLLLQDPAQRLTVPQVLDHPWTTLEGAFPLTPPSPRRLDEQQQEEEQAGGAEAGAAEAAASGGGGAGGTPRAGGGKGGSPAPSPAPSPLPLPAGDDPMEGRDVLAGLISPDLEVHTFGAGEVLMTQDEKGEGRGGELRVRGRRGRREAHGLVPRGRADK